MAVGQSTHSERLEPVRIALCHVDRTRHGTAEVYGPMLYQLFRRSALHQPDHALQSHLGMPVVSKHKSQPEGDPLEPPQVVHEEREVPDREGASPHRLSGQQQDQSDAHMRHIPGDRLQQLVEHPVRYGDLASRLIENPEAADCPRFGGGDFHSKHRPQYLAKKPGDARLRRALGPPVSLNSRLRQIGDTDNAKYGQEDHQGDKGVNLQHDNDGNRGEYDVSKPLYQAGYQFNSLLYVVTKIADGLAWGLVVGVRVTIAKIGLKHIRRDQRA